MLRLLLINLGTAAVVDKVAILVGRLRLATGVTVTSGLLPLDLALVDLDIAREALGSQHELRRSG